MELVNSVLATKGYYVTVLVLIDHLIKNRKVSYRFREKHKKTNIAIAINYNDPKLLFLVDLELYVYMFTIILIPATS